MKYIILVAIVAVIAGLIVGQFFRAAFEKKIESKIDMIIASSTPEIIQTLPLPTPEVKGSFKGPTGQPRVVGPSGPPPSY